jgi:hypothetical protein
MAQNEAEKKAEGAPTTQQMSTDLIQTTGAAAGAVLEEPGKKKKK